MHAWLTNKQVAVYQSFSALEPCPTVVCFDQLTIEIENVTIFSGATKMYYSDSARQSSILRFIGN